MLNGVMAAVIQSFGGQQDLPGFTGRDADQVSDFEFPETKPKKDDSPFPSLKRRTAEDRAEEVIVHLQEIILNPGREDGSTGMHYGDWSKAARTQITKTVREAESSAAFREFFSASRLGGLCLRVGFLLMASVASFGAFWFGILFLWQKYGYVWGMAATLSALGLSLAFVTAGLMYGQDNMERERERAKEKYQPKFKGRGPRARPL